MTRRPPRSTHVPCTTLFRSSLTQLETAPAPPVVVDLRLLVHPTADAVTDERADDVEAARLGVLLHGRADVSQRSEEHSLNSSHANISYAVFCLKKKSLTIYI